LKIAVPCGRPTAPSEASPYQARVAGVVYGLFSFFMLKKITVVIKR
jgi:hypothetical protein